MSVAGEPQSSHLLKGPFASRHTSAERRAPGLSSHPGARRDGAIDSQGSLSCTWSGRLTSATHLSEHVIVHVLTLRLAHVRHIQRPAAPVDDRPPCELPTLRTWRERRALTPCVASGPRLHHTGRAPARRALYWRPSGPPAVGPSARSHPAASSRASRHARGPSGATAIRRA